MPSRRELANAVRALSMDAVQAANSGHPGMPMGMADIAEVLFNEVLVHDPATPGWFDRDRLVVSNGHGSMLLYAALHLSGYDLPMDELRRFRQLHSRTPGHPEYGLTPGVETTTGPLGQGLANAVGMAMAERMLAATFNRPGHDVIDHHTYVLAGDGCLMEGISHEACSLAGTLGLGKLVAIYDDNGISIDGPVEGWYTDDTPARFEAYGWRVIRDVDGHDAGAIAAALAAARESDGRPTLVCCKTTIGWGSPGKAGSAGSHGAPLGADEIAATREQIGWSAAPFEIPDGIYAGWDGRARGKAAREAWEARLAAYRAEHPELAAELDRRSAGDLPTRWTEALDDIVAAMATESPTVASRKASQNSIEALAPLLPELLGGSADLTGSNLTAWAAAGAHRRDAPTGAHVNYGVREFAMAAINNGLALHGALIPFCGTFLTFSDYARNALRMAALMRIRSIFVFTHDSIGLGEDGPTHQAVEHAASLRLMPGMDVWRPCDAVETMVAWRAAVERADGPSSLLLSRQSLPGQPWSEGQLAGAARGGYVRRDCEGEPRAVLIATGSEVALAVEAAARLQSEGHRVRVVSMPCAERFEAQPREYRDAVLPPGLRARVAVEAGVTDGWRKYVGLDGAVVGLDQYGESAPAAQVFEHFGFTVEHVCKTVLESMRGA